jgi:hypothetical protein
MCSSTACAPDVLETLVHTLLLLQVHMKRLY